MVLRPSEEHTGQVEADSAREVMRSRGTTTSEREGVVDSGAGGAGAHADLGGGGSKRSPFVLLLKKAMDLVLQPFQSLQVCPQTFEVH